MNKFKLSLWCLLISSALIALTPSAARAQNSPTSTFIANPRTEVPCPASVDGLIAACDKAADELKAAQAVIAAQADEIKLLRARAQLAEERLQIEKELSALRQRENAQLRAASEGYEVRIAELEIQLENKEQAIHELDKRLAVAKRTTKLAAIGSFILGVIVRLKL
jgi:hypothetical protein